MIEYDIYCANMHEFNFDGSLTEECVANNVNGFDIEVKPCAEDIVGCLTIRLNFDALNMVSLYLEEQECRELEFALHQAIVRRFGNRAK